MISTHVFTALIVFSALLAGSAQGDDWPMRGRDGSRNAATLEKGPPVEWTIRSKKQVAKNLRWMVEIGGFNLADPIVADGLVWIGTNNDQPRDPARTEDAGVLACFREQDGQFVYQLVSPRMTEGKRFDWENTGLASSPLIEGDRLWFCNNRYEVICLDIGPLKKGGKGVREIWKLDLRKSLGVVPHAKMIGSSGIHCSVARFRDLIYVNTTNARYGNEVPAPDAPSLLCLQKETGKVVWQDNSPGGDILDVQHGSPLVIELDGKAQAIMAQGDGWVRSFDALTGKLLWKFDINFKAPGPRAVHWHGTINYFVASPVFYGQRVYVASGREPEMGEGPGRLVCLNPAGRGDVSSEVEDGAGHGKPNPNSGLVWEYVQKMGATMSSVAIQNDLVIAPDFGGKVHCLDALTGKEHWVYDMQGHIFASPLIADGKVYVGDEDGDLVILNLNREKKQIAEHTFGAPIYAGPVYANGVLYVLTYGALHAIGSRTGN